MPVNYNPTTTTDGLVCCLDAASPRSFRGEPGTNLVSYPEASWNGTSIVTGYNVDATGTRTIEYKTQIENPINSDGVFRYSTGTTGYKYFTINTTVPSAGTYTFSYYARIISGPTETSTLGNSQIWRDVYSGGSTDRATTGDRNPTLTREWVRYSETSTVTTTLYYFPLHGGSILGDYVIEYCGFQLEQGSTAKTWRNGTIGSTPATGGGWVDLTNNNSNNSILVSPTYSSNYSGSLVFDGATTAMSSSWPSALNVVDNTTPRSWECWITPNGSTLSTFQNVFGHSVNVSNSYYANGGVTISGGRFGFRWYDNSAYREILSTTTATEAPYHIVCTFDPTDQKPRIYVNGVLETTYGSATNLNYSSGMVLFEIGYHGKSGTEYYYNGEIHQVKFYKNKALSASEVKKNFETMRKRFGL